MKRTAFKDDPKIVNVVGEIFYDSISDKSEYKICGRQNRIVQYYAFNEKTFRKEKGTLVDYFSMAYIPVNSKNNSGLIRIRFVVNCKGEAGRFRLLSMDNKYREKVFPKTITQQLMSLTKNYDGWKAMHANGEYRDYYQYLIFKMEYGNLIEIMP